MKAITLIQPWASLIVDGRKKIETRSWPTSYRGLLAIHAGKKMEEEFAAIECGYTEMPLGSVLGIAELVDCVRMTPATIAATDDYERLWGCYEVGRFAWHLRLLEKFASPIPARGAQGLWNWNAPEEIAKRYAQPRAA